MMENIEEAEIKTFRVLVHYKMGRPTDKKRDETRIVLFSDGTLGLESKWNGEGEWVDGAESFPRGTGDHPSEWEVVSVTPDPGPPPRHDAFFLICELVKHALVVTPPEPGKPSADAVEAAIGWLKYYEWVAR